MGAYTDRSSAAERDDNAVLGGKRQVPKHQIQVDFKEPEVTAEQQRMMDAMNEDEQQPEKRTKTGGRQAGTPNKVQRVDIAKVCRLYSLRAVETLLDVMENPDESGATRVAAANAILDRAHGKAKQMTEISGIDGADIQTKLTIEFVGQPPIRATVDAQIEDKAGEIIDMQLETVRVPEKRRPWDPA